MAIRQLIPTGHSNRGSRWRGGGGKSFHLGFVPMISDFKRNIIIVFIAVIVFGPLAWMLFDRSPPYTFEHVEISPTTVEQGGTMDVTFTVRPQRAPCSPGLIYRTYKEIPSGKLHVFDPIMRAAAPTQNKFTRMAKLPDNISPGATVYRGTACYTCNPLHTWLRWPVCVHTPDVTFTVLEKPMTGARNDHR